jgi:hypothetical protein
LVNAWFDYVSYALTLTLVRWGLKAKGWAAALYGALDVVVAFVLFSLLGATLTAIAALLNRHVTADFYPLAPVFAGAARGDPQYFWLYGMIFSTFVPTFLHLSIASLSLISIVPQGWRLWLWDINTIPADDWLRRAIGCAGIGLVATLAAGLPLAVAWGVISALLSHFHEIGTGYLTIFRWVATTLGEPI